MAISQSDSLRLVYMGNGPFAVPGLLAVADSQHELIAVVTRPDRPQGKHLEIVAGPVTAAAKRLGLAIHQPESVNDPEFCKLLQLLSADLFVVADFGQILSAECLAAARLGGLNIHASLLPRYRGAAPVAWAIYHGEVKTGVSIIQMTTRLDAGGVVAQAECSIGPDETAAELESRLAELGAPLVVEAVDRIATGSATRIEQDESGASRAPKLKMSDGRIRWDRTAKQIHNQVRAMQPWPVAHTFLHPSNGRPFRTQILKTGWRDSDASGIPGAIVGVEANCIRVHTGSGELLIYCLKPAGKREMDAATFLRGHRVQPGDRLGDETA